jgi:hypothetical protein
MFYLLKFVRQTSILFHSIGKKPTILVVKPTIETADGFYYFKHFNGLGTY